MELKWEISGVLSDKKTGLIAEAKYTLIASKDDSRSLKTGKVSFGGDSTSKSFIEFEKLTEEQVLSWVKSSLGDKVSSIEKLATDELNALIIKKEAITTSDKSLPKLQQETMKAKRKEKLLAASKK